MGSIPLGHCNEYGLFIALLTFIEKVQMRTVCEYMCMYMCVRLHICVCMCICLHECVFHYLFLLVFRWDKIRTGSSALNIYRTAVYTWE